MHAVPGEVREAWVPWDWSCRRLLVTKVKEMEPESSGREAGALNQ